MARLWDAIRQSSERGGAVIRMAAETEPAVLARAVGGAA
jgi:hypothetical protein